MTRLLGGLVSNEPYVGEPGFRFTLARLLTSRDEMVTSGLGGMDFDGVQILGTRADLGITTAISGKRIFPLPRAIRENSEAGSGLTHAGSPWLPGLDRVSTEVKPLCPA